MVVIGLTGGYSSGKSTVTKMFQKLGAEVIYSDKIAHKIISRNTKVLNSLIEAFGKEIVNKDQKINRKKLGKIVFSDQSKLRKLNKLVHPSVKAELKKIIKDKKLKASKKILILEVPLLFEAGTRSWFDSIIVVSCCKEKQYKMAFKRGHITKSDFLKRLRSQWPLQRKEKYADFIVDNNRRISDTKKQVIAIWNKFKKEVNKNI